MDKGKKKGGGTVSVNFSHILFSFLSTHDDLMMQALVWFHMVQFRAIRFGRIQFRSSHTNLKQPHIFKHQMYGKNLALHSSKYGISKLPFGLKHIKALTQTIRGSP